MYSSLSKIIKPLTSLQEQRNLRNNLSPMPIWRVFWLSTAYYQLRRGRTHAALQLYQHHLEEQSNYQM